MNIFNIDENSLFNQLDTYVGTPDPEFNGIFGSQTAPEPKPFSLFGEIFASDG